MFNGDNNNERDPNLNDTHTNHGKLYTFHFVSRFVLCLVHTFLSVVDRCRRLFVPVAQTALRRDAVFWRTCQKNEKIKEE